MTHFSEAQKAEIEAIVEAKMKAVVHDALNEYFRGYGSSTIAFVTQTAIVLTSFTAVIYSVKTIAGWFGIFITRG